MAVLDDGGLPSPAPLSVEERLERAVYLADQVRLVAKYAGGEAIALSGNQKGGKVV